MSSTVGRCQRRAASHEWHKLSAVQKLSSRSRGPSTYLMCRSSNPMTCNACRCEPRPSCPASPSSASSCDCSRFRSLCCDVRKEKRGKPKDFENATSSESCIPEPSETEPKETQKVTENVKSSEGEISQQEPQELPTNYRTRMRALYVRELLLSSLRREWHANALLWSYGMHMYWDECEAMIIFLLAGPLNSFLVF